MKRTILKIIIMSIKTFDRILIASAIAAVSLYVIMLYNVLTLY